MVILGPSLDARQGCGCPAQGRRDGYSLKDTEPDMLLAQLADVMTGKQILSEPLRPYLENIYELDHLQQKLESLTRREMQIMREMPRGCPTSRSPQCSISPKEPSRSTSRAC